MEHANIDAPERMTHNPEGTRTALPDGVKATAVMSRSVAVIRLYSGAKSLMHAGIAARDERLKNLFPEMVKWVQD